MDLIYKINQNKKIHTKAVKENLMPKIDENKKN